jgi:DNA-binding protein YbaB
MFDKFKQAKKIKDLQKNLSKEKESCQKEGVKVTVNGQMQVENIEINSEVEVAKTQDLVKECTNEALKKVQKKAAKMMQGMGGF